MLLWFAETVEWDALVGIGTVLLGLATFWLGWHTRNLAVTSAADLQTQSRPIILPGSNSIRDGTAMIALPLASFDPISGTLSVLVRNAGRGPALYVRTELDPEGEILMGGPIAALAVGDEQILDFKNVKPESHLQLLLDYRDLAGRTYSTSITLDLPGSRAYDVRLFEGASTHHGDAVYPQPGLRDARKALGKG